MLDFDFLTTPTPVQNQVVTSVTETVRVVPNQAVGYVGKPPAQWNWSDLRDYIIAETEARHGAQVRDPRKESGIIKSFIARWGIERAVAIAQAAFEVHGGMWRNAPVTIVRFTKGSDPYFSQVIAENLPA